MLLNGTLRSKLFFDTDDPPSGGDDADNPEPESKKDQPPEKPTSQKKDTDWEAAYKGLQRNYSKLEKELGDLKVKYDTAVEELEGLKQSQRTSSDEKSTLQKQNVELTSKLKELEEKESNRTLERDRYQLILDEFPDLAAFEAKGLLPAGNNSDELREKFSNFREALDKTGRDKVQEVISGTDPSVVSDNNEDLKKKRTKDQVYDELVALSGSQDPKDRQKYDALMDEWVAMN